MYEKYFDKKYGGDNYEKNQVLASFLKDELLQIYEIKGGLRVKYGKMRKYLLAYYQEKKIGTRKYWKAQLEDMAPEVDEGYDMFGLRLLGVAKRAYASRGEAAEEVRKPYLRRMPAHIKAKIADAELLNAAQGRGNHLPFKSLMMIARKSQIEQAATKTVMFAHTVEEDEGTAVERDHDTKTRFFKKQTRASQKTRPNTKPWSPTARKSPDRNIQCFHCGNKGHKRDECWIRQGRCRICGGQHEMEKCPRYDPDYRSKSRSRRDRNNQDHLNS